MEYFWVVSAFAAGFLFRLLRMPPLVGFLVAGFVMNAIGVEPNQFIDVLADLGVTLLLFTIGLKIDMRNLGKREILTSASLQVLGTVVTAIIMFKLFMFLGIYAFASLDLLQAFYIGLALSFSSTVCAVKILEEGNELKTRHGQITLSLLVIQDIIAVVLLSLSKGVWPGVEALLLLLLFFARPLISKLLDSAGHGEILPLAGIFLALSGGELFELFGLKADLGALVFGMLLSRDRKASELSKALLSFKDLFLICFFFSIGLKADLPTFETFVCSLLLIAMLGFKVVVFFFSLVYSRLRVRTSFLTALVLTNYSEFGLIVSVVFYKNGLIDSEWLMIIAVAVAISFILTSIVSRNAHMTYSRMSHLLKRFEIDPCLPEDSFRQPEDAEIIVVGMGRVGKGAYMMLEKSHPNVIWGIDASKLQVEKLVSLGMQATVGDAEDNDFWHKVDFSRVKLIMLAMPSHRDMVEVISQLKLAGYEGKIAGIAKYEDQRQHLLDLGVDVAFNFYAEAGAGFAEESLHLLEEEVPA